MAVTRASQRVTVVSGVAPSPFVAELQGLAPPAAPSTGPASDPGPHARPTLDLTSRSRQRRRAPGGSTAPPALVDALKAWRRERSRRDGVPAFVVFPDATLDLIAATAPRTLVALSRLHGIGPTKLDRYGDEVLAVVDEAAGAAG